MNESRSAPKWRSRWLIAIVVIVVAGAIVWTSGGAKEASIDDAIAAFEEAVEAGGAGGTIDDVLRPEQGVYVYAGTGHETLSLPGTGRAWGPRIPGIVTHAPDGCWTFQLEYNTAHSQSVDYCPRERRLEEHSSETSHAFNLGVTTLHERIVFACDPPGETIRVDADAGASWKQSCVGTSAERGTVVTSSGVNVFVGLATVEVAGKDVAAYHYRTRRTLSGDQTGTELVDIWFRVPDGLPLRATHDIEAISPSPVGSVTYTEAGSFTLTSLRPRS